MPGCHLTRQTLLAPSFAKRREVLTSRMKGELHPTIIGAACEADLHINGSFNGSVWFPVWPLQKYSNGSTMQPPLGCLTINRINTRYVLRSYP